MSRGASAEAGEAARDDVLLLRHSPRRGAKARRNQEVVRDLAAGRREGAYVKGLPCLRGKVSRVGAKQGGKRGRTLRARTPLAHAGGGGDDAGDARAMQRRGCRRCADSRTCCRRAQLPLQAADDTKPPVAEEEEIPALLRKLTRCCGAAPAMATAAARVGDDGAARRYGRRRR